MEPSIDIGSKVHGEQFWKFFGTIGVIIFAKIAFFLEIFRNLGPKSGQKRLKMG